MRGTSDRTSFVAYVCSFLGTKVFSRGLRRGAGQWLLEWTLKSCISNSEGESDVLLAIIAIARRDEKLFSSTCDIRTVK